MDSHMSLFHLWIQRLVPKKLNSIPFLEHLVKFHLDLCSLMLVPKIVLRLLEEQANTISNKNRIKLVLRVLVFSFG